MDRQLFYIAFFIARIFVGCIGSQGVSSCPSDDLTCQKDHVGFEAVSQLHSQIDDNHDGGLNFAESDEFVRDDLKYADGLTKRNFHSNDDFITVHDLWRLWVMSEAYNWTTDDVINWLTVHVELPQYVENFRSSSVNGRLLPRLASNSQSFATNLGIKNPVHKQKLAIKATDLVLFGPPKSSHNYLKDLAVVASLLVGAISAYLAYRQHSNAQYLNQKASKDLSDLQNAEDTLRLLQQDLDKAQKEQQTIADDKLNLEKRLQNEIKLHKEEAEKYRLQRDPSDESSELKLAEEELVQVRLALYNAERRLEENQCLPLAELQQWLQLSYEIETRYFEAKREATEKQLKAAKEMCEKIRKQKGKFLGAFRVAHTTSLDETDHKIMSVRASLEDVKMDMQERMQRWQHIEGICRFSIICNPGMAHLEIQLKQPERSHVKPQHGHLTLDDSDESLPSTILAQSILQPSVSDLSFRSASFAVCATGGNTPPQSRKSAGRGGQAVSTLPPAGLRSRSSKPLLNEKGSQESILSQDQMVTSTSTEKPTAVVFDLGGDMSVRPPVNTNSSSSKLPALTEQTPTSKTEPFMTKSLSLPNPSNAQARSVPNSLSEIATSSSDHTISTVKHLENVPLRTGASSSKIDRLDSGINGSHDDGNNSSDSVGTSLESIGKEKKKKFSIFKRPKAN